MANLQQIIYEIELHSVEGIKQCFQNGLNPNDLFNNQPLIYELISEYTRSPKFKDCVKVFLEYGLQFDDKALLSVLCNDGSALALQLKSDPEIVKRRYVLRCAYTPLYQVTLLHICAEFNHRDCAEVLVKNGADINEKAGIDEHGFGGQTPIFHTVNQNSNQSFEMLDFLISKSADLHYTVPGLIWGKSYEWETLIPAVNPISYAMMGLLPQLHRKEDTIAKIVSTLLKVAYDIDYVPTNVPNAYLKH
jgi:ankyrin repeat protein